MRKKFIAMLATMIFSVGCASVQPVSFQYSEKYFPEIGKLERQELGSTLLSYINVAEMDSFRIVSQIKAPTNMFGAFMYIPPQVLRPSTINDKGETVYEAISTRKTGLQYKIQTVVRGNKLCHHIINDIPVAPTCWDSQLIPEKYVDLNSPSIHQELIYNGRSGDAVNFLYREITGAGIMRTPFTQNITYDLSLGAEIGFKGARFEVIEATNREITYRVLRSFDKFQ